MNISEFDTTITNTELYNKVSNMFTLLCTSIMQLDLERCKHKLSEEVYEKYNIKVQNMIAQNHRQMYDELNIKETKIKNIDVDENGINIDVLITARYMDYIVNKDDFSLVSGNNTSRIEKKYLIKLHKVKDARELSTVRRCPGCGAPADISSSGKCDFCGAIFNTEAFDYIIVDIQSA